MVRLRLKYIPVQLISGLYRVPVCSKGLWDRLIQCSSEEDHAEICGELLEGVSLPPHECRLLVTAYIDRVRRFISETGLEIPFYPSSEREKDSIKYTVYTQTDKLAAEYAGLNIYEIDDISIIEYRLLVRDAFISKLAQTEKGREYLNNAYRLTQTEADEDLGI